MLLWSHGNAFRMDVHAYDFFLAWLCPQLELFWTLCHALTEWVLAVTQ